MELGIEAGDVDSIRQLLHAGIDNLESWAVMKGGKVAELFQMVVRVRGYYLRARIIASMYDAMASQSNVVFSLDLRQFRVVYERLQKDFEGVVLGGNLVLELFVFLDLDIGTRIGNLNGWGREAAD